MSSYPVTCPKCFKQVKDTAEFNSHHRICGSLPAVPGKKYDTDKLRFDLIPPIALKALASVLTMGAKKYGPNNWQDLADFEVRFTGALMRHINAWRSGEEVDLESKMPHLWHVLCNVVFLVWKEEKEDVSLCDDAPRKPRLPLCENCVVLNCGSRDSSVFECKFFAPKKPPLYLDTLIFTPDR